MTEKDVAYYCGQRSYITESAAAAIVGPQYDPASSAAAATASPQQSLLATAPVIPTLVQSARPTPTSAFFQWLAVNPIAAISDVVGFDMRMLVGDQPDSLGPPDAPPYEWTGCMADLYNPNEGSFNFELLASDYNTSTFDTGDISDPRSFEAMFGEVIQDGFQQLPVLDAPYDTDTGL